MTQNGSRPSAGSVTSLRPEEVSRLFSGFRHDLLGSIQPLILNVDNLLELAEATAEDRDSRLETRFSRLFGRLEEEIRALVWLAEWLGGGSARLQSPGLEELIGGFRSAREGKVRASAASIFAKAVRFSRLALYAKLSDSDRRIDLRLRAAPSGRTAPVLVAGCLLGSISPEQALEAGCSARLAASAWVLGRTIENRGCSLSPGRSLASVVIREF